MTEVSITIANRSIVNMKEFRDAFRDLKDGNYKVSIKDNRKRSLDQNGYYWSVVVPLVQVGLYDIGYDEVRTNDQAHSVMKGLFIKEQYVNKQTGEVLESVGSSAKLPIPNFNEYLERIWQWASEYLGIVIPSPNKQYADFKELESKIQTDGEEIE